MKAHKILVKRLSLEELECRVRKAIRLKQKLWTQEEIDFHARRANEWLKLFSKKIT